MILGSEVEIVTAVFFSEFTGTFRGHPLDGTKISLPEGYRALLVTEAKKPLADDADRRFQVSLSFLFTQKIKKM